MTATVAVSDMTPCRRRLRPAISMESTSEFVQDDSRGKVAMPPEMKRRRAASTDDIHQWQKCGDNSIDALQKVRVVVTPATPSPAKKQRRLIIRSKSDEGADDLSTDEPVSDLVDCESESPAGGLLTPSSSRRWRRRASPLLSSASSPLPLPVSSSLPLLQLQAHQQSAAAVGTPSLESDAADASSASTSPAHGPVSAGDWTVVLSACHCARDCVRAGGREAGLPEAAILKAQLLACRLLQGSSLSFGAESIDEDWQVLSATAARAALESMGAKVASLGQLEVDDFMLSLFLVQLSHSPKHKVALDHTAEFIDILVAKLPLTDVLRRSGSSDGASSPAAGDPAVRQLRSSIEQASCSFVIDGAMNPAMGRLDPRVSAAAAVALAALFVLRRHGMDVSADEVPSLLCRESGLDLWSLRLGAELTLQVFRQWKRARSNPSDEMAP